MGSTPSDQDYLEKILILEQSGHDVRAVDIANYMNFSRPSVSNAMKKLREAGYVEVDDNRIALTKAGREIATAIYERHEVIARWLMTLGVDAETAYSDSCRMEHVISQKSFEKIRALWQANDPEVAQS